MTRPLHIYMVNVNAGLFEEWSMALNAILEMMDIYQSDTLPEIQGVLAYEDDFCTALSKENLDSFQKTVTAPRFIRSVPYTPLERVIASLEDMFDMSRCTQIVCFDKHKNQGDILRYGIEVVRANYPNKTIEWRVEPLSSSSIEAWKATMLYASFQSTIPESTTPKPTVRI